MLRSVSNARDDILAMALEREIRITTIDPGTNCALRHSALRAHAYAPGEKAAFNTRALGQTFFRGLTAGADYVERMQMLSKHMETDPDCQRADVYVIEGQFELNVSITVGVLIGIISGLRSREVEVRTKRSGARAPAAMPYMILEIPASFKTHALRVHGGRPDGKIAKEEFKELACIAATKICRDLDDMLALELMQDSAKADDIADTICHEYALFAYLHDPARLQPSSKVKRRSK
jgi:hypothetical protein